MDRCDVSYLLIVQGTPTLIHRFTEASFGLMHGDGEIITVDGGVGHVRRLAFNQLHGMAEIPAHPSLCPDALTRDQRLSGLLDLRNRNSWPSDANRRIFCGGLRPRKIRSRRL
jgi:hypothetical protein